MALEDLMNPPGDDSWYDQLWFDTVESNLNMLRSIKKLNAQAVPPIAHEHFKHNFHGYIRENITEERKYWYVIMRCNNMFSPDEFDENNDYVIWPNLQVIDELHDLYLASLPTN